MVDVGWCGLWPPGAECGQYAGEGWCGLELEDYCVGTSVETALAAAGAACLARRGSLDVCWAGAEGGEAVRAFIRQPFAEGAVAAVV